MNKEVAISVKDLYKSFRLPHEQHSGLKQFIVNIFRRNRVKGYEDQRVLKGLSFDVKKGDFFGVVGRNGSGKSTLLKLLAGIYTPDRGSISVNGTLVPFIELGVGFNPELTGRENVYLNGALLGFSHKQMDAMYDQIVEFAELERFMDQKLKNYSSGMQVRLAFSIAIRAESDILVLDEVLAVGDDAFQRKCYAYFAELKRKKKTVILVTHGMDAVQQFCNKALLIDAGKIVEYGNPSKVAGKYLELNNNVLDSTKTSDSHLMEANDWGVVADVQHEIKNDKVIFNIEIKARQQLDEAVVAFLLNRDTGETVYRWTTDSKSTLGKAVTIKKDKPLRICLELENIFPDGEFDVQLVIKKIDRSINYALFNRILTFRMINPDIQKRSSHWKPKETFTYEQY